MDLLIPLRNLLVGAMATRLNGGSLVFYDGTPARRLSNALVEVPLPSPAFGAPSGGEVVSFEMLPVRATLSGDIGWAQFVTADGVAVANATVSAKGGSGDIQLERIDDDDHVIDLTPAEVLHVERGGKFTIGAVILRMPQSVEISS